MRAMFDVSVPENIEVFVLDKTVDGEPIPKVGALFRTGRSAGTGPGADGPETRGTAVDWRSYDVSRRETQEARSVAFLPPQRGHSREPSIRFYRLGVFALAMLE